MKTHELYIEDAPEEFYARAYDDQGNCDTKNIPICSTYQPLILWSSVKKRIVSQITPVWLMWPCWIAGNEFSSLEGLVFRWAFEGLSTDVDSDEPVLRWVKFSDSSYDVIPSIARLEAQGQQGHVVLIEGLRTGSARVSLQLESDFFRVGLLFLSRKFSSSFSRVPWREKKFLSNENWERWLRFLGTGLENEWMNSTFLCVCVC